MSGKLGRIFDCMGGNSCAWWIIILFFLFLVFGESWVDIDICAWIPFLILLLIVISCETGRGLDGCLSNNFDTGC